MQEYVEILLSFNSKATIFSTGKCVRKNKCVFKSLAKNEMIELGGHTYTAFRPRILHFAFHAISKSYYGPRFYQRWDIERCLSAFEEIGMKPKVWRTHAYAGDKITYSILNALGFIAVSDKRQLCTPIVKKECGNLYHVYITMPADEEISPRALKQNEEWKTRFLRAMRSEIEKGADIVFNLHPKRMKMLDDFETFAQILKELKRKNYKFLKISEMVEEFKLKRGFQVKT